MKIYTFWSQDDKAFIATCDKYPSLSGISTTKDSAIEELKIAIEGAEQPEPKSCDNCGSEKPRFCHICDRVKLSHWTPVQQQPEPKCKTCGHSNGKGEKISAYCFDCTQGSEYRPDCNQQEELKPCAHDGGAAHIFEQKVKYGIKYQAGCTTCSIRTGWFPTRGLARKAWNTRNNAGKE